MVLVRVRVMVLDNGHGEGQDQSGLGGLGVLTDHISQEGGVGDPREAGHPLSHPAVLQAHREGEHECTLTTGSAKHPTNRFLLSLSDCWSIELGQNKEQPENCIAPLVGDKCPSKVAKGTCEGGKQQSVPSPDLVREHPEDEAARQQPDHEEGVDGRGPDVLAAVLK